MKINTRTIIVSFLLIMSFTSYVFLSNLEVSEPDKVTTSEYLESNDANENEKSSTMLLPDLNLVQKIFGAVSTVIQN